ncbi:MAG: carbohydrate ABC transporter permease [Oscillospiraceae bacterium]|nr:carbohydrate ABC transporter permease [Oscillospiraceae bacterium]
MVQKRSIGDYLLDFFVYAFLTVLTITILYPFINAMAISFNNADDTMRGGIYFLPRVPTVESYVRVFTNPRIWNAYFITISRTLVGTVSALFVTSLIAFALSNAKLVGRRFYSLFCIIPMYFGGGLIPYYMLIRNLELMNTFWVFIIPNLVGLFNVILMRTFFQEIPESIKESAHIDGANYITVYFKIILPISTPILATIALFIGVFHWNSWFDATIFITRDELKPMQNILLQIVNEAAFAERIAALAGGAGGGGASAAAAAMGNISRGRPVNVRSITLATMFVTIFPVLIVYPFLQRFFVKGIMIGSVKG